jgi:hypothetical protein
LQMGNLWACSLSHGWPGSDLSQPQLFQLRPLYL